jgi:two-component sensor histidine kinase
VIAEKHPKEDARLAALARYDILDTPSEVEFDDVVKIVSAFCETPVSLISLVGGNRQWFKAKFGIALTETPIIESICAHGILGDGIFEVSDTTKDSRTSDNPLVAGDPNVRFYAGAPLQTHDGLPLGMLCVLDTKPRVLTPPQRELLRVMATQVMNQLELRRTLKLEREARSSLETLLEQTKNLLDQNEVLRQEVDHRVKNSLQQVVSFLAIQEKRASDPVAAAMIAEARGRVSTVASVHEHLHRAMSADRIQVQQFLRTLTQTISENRPSHVGEIRVEADPFELRSDRIMALGLVTNELISNAMKHAFPEGRDGKVHVGFKKGANDCILTVRDDGIGLPADFDPAKSRGLGMRVLSALTSQLRGRLEHRSDASGSRFELHFPCEVA